MVQTDNWILIGTPPNDLTIKFQILSGLYGIHSFVKDIAFVFVDVGKKDSVAPLQSF